MLVIQRVAAIPPGINTLVWQSAYEGFYFLHRLENQWRSGVNRFDLDGEFLLAARRSDKITGVCGVNIDPYIPLQDVARIRHLYVSPPDRLFGIGSELVNQCLDKLHCRFNSVRLRTPNVETGKFYEKLGFKQVNDATATHILKF